MSFLKAKTTTGKNVLIAVDKIASVEAAEIGTVVELTDGQSVPLELGFQAVSNRLQELGADIA